VKTRVVHCKKERYDVYCGRPSKWGNPFSHLNDTSAEFRTSTRTESIEKFEEYLLNNKELMGALCELKGKVLGCWCKPKPCHCDILAKYADSPPLF